MGIKVMIFSALILLFIFNASSQILINEIFPNPAANSGNELEWYQQEWVEIYNSGNNPVNLNGWKLKDAANNTIHLSGTILPEGFAVFSFGKEGRALNNNGDTVLLYKDDNLIDEATYPNFHNFENQSYGRCPDGSNHFIIFSQDDVSYNSSNGKIMNINKSKCYSTIQESVNDANPEDMIIVGNGTFVEEIFINKSLTLKGSNNTVIRAPEDLTDRIEGPDEMRAIIFISGNANPTIVNIKNFIIDGNGLKNSGVEFAGIACYGASCLIKNNIIRNSTFGIFANSPSLIIKNRIYGNNFGILLSENSECLGIYGNDIFDNSVGIEASANCMINFNNIYGNGLGINNLIAIKINAENNFWGRKSGPAENEINGNVDYEPWLGYFIDIDSFGPEFPLIFPEIPVTSEDGDISVKAYGNATGELFFFKYKGNPGGTSPVFTSRSKFFDIFFKQFPSPDRKINRMEIIFCNPGGNIIFWWDGNSWQSVSDQKVISTNPLCVKINVTDSTSPSLNDLKGTPFGGGILLKVPVMSYAFLIFLFIALLFLSLQRL